MSTDSCQNQKVRGVAAFRRAERRETHFIPVHFYFAMESRMRKASGDPTVDYNKYCFSMLPNGIYKLKLSHQIKYLHLIYTPSVFG